MGQDIPSLERRMILIGHYAHTLFIGCLGQSSEGLPCGISRSGKSGGADLPRAWKILEAKLLFFTDKSTSMIHERSSRCAVGLVMIVDALKVSETLALRKEPCLVQERTKIKRHYGLNQTP